MLYTSAVEGWRQTKDREHEMKKKKKHNKNMTDVS